LKLTAFSKFGVNASETVREMARAGENGGEICSVPHWPAPRRDRNELVAPFEVADSPNVPNADQVTPFPFAAASGPEAASPHSKPGSVPSMSGGVTIS
jgi:hypothetical protein